MSEKIPESFNYDESRFREYFKRFSSLRMKVGEYENDSWIEFEDDVVRKADELKARYGSDVSNYAMWHVLGGSTIADSSLIIAEDFPGEDSVADFVEYLEHKYGTK